MISAMSSPRVYDDPENSSGSDGEGPYNYDNTRTVGLRRRHNAKQNSPNRNTSPKRGGDSDDDRKGRRQKEVHGFPKKLTPFFQLNDPDTGFASLPNSPFDARSASPKKSASYEEKKKPFPPPVPFQSDDEEENAVHDEESQRQKPEVVSEKKTRFDLQREQSYTYKSVTVPGDSSLEDLHNSGISALSGEYDEETTGYAMEDPRADDKEKRGENYSTRSSENISSDSEDDTPSRSKIQGWRLKIGRLVNNEYVQLTIILLIIINAIMMGVSTYPFVREDPDKAAAFTAVDKTFLWIFTVEVAMQLISLGPLFFTDRWLVFDFVIVLISHFAEKIQVIRAFRIFRMFRLVTRVKPLRDLVLALGQVMPRMTGICFLLFIIFYVFAVLFTELFGEFIYFTTLWDSLFTAFQMMTLEWADICREVNSVKPWAWVVFVSYIMIAGFIVFNLIVAVVVEAVAATEDTVRALDGQPDESPEARLAEAEERVDLLQMHLDDMMNQQEQIQFMLETMAGELLHLETERMKAKHRESKLREEINRRIEIQRQMEAQNPQNKVERKSSLRQRRNRSIDSLSSSVHGDDSSRGSATGRKNYPFNAKRIPSISRDTSTRSMSGDSNSYQSDRSTTLTAPMSAPTIRRKLDLKKELTAAGIKPLLTEEEKATRSKKAKESWKSLLAIQKL